MHEVYDLTPRQIQEVYFHPRDKDGAIKFPAGGSQAPAEARLAQLLTLAPSLGVPPEQLQELKRRLEAHRV